MVLVHIDTKLRPRTGADVLDQDQRWFVVVGEDDRIEPRCIVKFRLLKGHRHSSKYKSMVLREGDHDRNRAFDPIVIGLQLALEDDVFVNFRTAQDIYAIPPDLVRQTTNKFIELPMKDDKRHLRVLRATVFQDGPWVTHQTEGQTYAAARKCLLQLGEATMSLDRVYLGMLRRQAIDAINSVHSLHRVSSQLCRRPRATRDYPDAALSLADHHHRCSGLHYWRWSARDSAATGDVRGLVYAMAGASTVFSPDGVLKVDADTQLVHHRAPA